MRAEQKAGIQIPVGKVGRIIRKQAPGGNLSSSASVYLAGVLDFLSHDIFDAAKVAQEKRSSKSTVLKIEDLMEAVRVDPQLHHLFDHVRVSAGKTMNRTKIALAQMPTKDRKAALEEYKRKVAARAQAKAAAKTDKAEKAS